MHAKGCPCSPVCTTQLAPATAAAAPVRQPSTTPAAHTIQTRISHHSSMRIQRAGLNAAAEAAMHLHHCAHNIPQPVHPPALQMTRKRRQAFHVHPPHQQIQVASSKSEGPMTARDPTRMPFQEVHAFQHDFWLPVAHICKKQGPHKHSRACAAAAASAQPAGQHTRHAPGRHQTPIHTDIVLGCQPRMRKAREL